MEYLEAVKTLREIEEKYEVMSVKMKGIAIWPYLRIYLFDAMATHKAQGISSAAARSLQKDLFFFNPLRNFKRYDIWNFSSRVTRKKVGDYYVHHVSGALHNLGRRVLTVEGSARGMEHVKRSEIPEKNIVSFSWFTFVYGIFTVILRLFPTKIEGEQIIKQIVEDYHIAIDYKERARMLYAQRLASDFFFSINFKPKLLIMECSYTQMGRVWSAHNRGIPVVELQHGVINANHYAYSPKYHSDILYPDEICVYGEEELKYFQTLGKQFASKVSMTGLYILELAEKKFTNDIFRQYRSKYKTVAVVSGQTGFEEQLSMFIDHAADKLQDVMFIYIPRRPDDSIDFQHSNVEYVYGVNIYQYLKWCDVHITISSTTGLEAHYFSKPNVFCDFDGVAKVYYGNILNKDFGAFYINNEDEFIETIKNIHETIFEHKEIFAHNHEERLKAVIDGYLSES